MIEMISVRTVWKRILPKLELEIAEERALRLQYEEH